MQAWPWNVWWRLCWEYGGRTGCWMVPQASWVEKGFMREPRALCSRSWCWKWQLQQVQFAWLMAAALCNTAAGRAQSRYWVAETFTGSYSLLPANKGGSTQPILPLGRNNEKIRQVVLILHLGEYPELSNVYKKGRFFPVTTCFVCLPCFSFSLFLFMALLLGIYAKSKWEKVCGGETLLTTSF